MKHYLDITLLPDAEVSLGFLWQKIFQQVHIALADNKVGANKSAVGLSIVHYGDNAFPLGDKLRLLAIDEAALVSLNIAQWLSRLRDYCHITSIKSVPDNIEIYACFKRKPVKSLANKAKRRAAHLNKPYDEVLAYLQQENNSKNCQLPFITVESQQTKQLGHAQYQFPLFIEQTLSRQAVAGVFDCYGLAKTATVPWF